MTTPRTTWPAQIAVVLVLLPSGMASGASGFLSRNWPLGENASEAGVPRATAALSGGSHRGWGDLKPQDAAELFVAPTKLAFKTGAEGEAHLAKMFPGGQSQVKFETGVRRGAQRFRYVDQLADGIAHESKVGYTKLGAFQEKQIAKDAWLLKNGKVDGVTWHFFRSAETGQVGASPELLRALEKNGIKYIIYD